MRIRYKGILSSDKSSRKYKVLKIIKKEYGCLTKFIEDIELEVQP